MKSQKLPKRFEQWYKKLEQYKIPAKISFFVLGIASTAWFLARVIPKPQRAGYPCMQAAAPVMSSFVLYLLSISGAVVAFRKSKELLKKTKYIAAAGFLVAGLMASAIFFLNDVELSFGKTKRAAEFNQALNAPMGEAQGIHPGRVVWAWDTDATNEDCTFDISADDGYYESKNTDFTVVSDMFDKSILQLAGKSTIADSWDAIFHNFNVKKGKGVVGYQTGETIFIKVNQGSGSWASSGSEFQIQNWNTTVESLPQTVLPILRQLIDEYGIPQESIYVGDPISHMMKHFFDPLKAAYPNVKYFDASSSNNRTLTSGTTEDVIFYSDNGQVVDESADKLYNEMYNADYIINTSSLKAHLRAGVTLIAKNHFGSHTRNSAGHLHPGLVSTSNDGDDHTRDEFGVYRVLTDVLAHEHLGGKTILNIIDGLWGAPKEVLGPPVKWNMAPFNNDYPNSLFISQDPVALESVCFDFLRTEAELNPNDFNDRPLWTGVDEHMHHAADNSTWPDGIIYDPEDDGTPIPSMGTHEHWNGVSNKQYTRNLGSGKGIELVTNGLSNNAPFATQQTDTFVLKNDGQNYVIIDDLDTYFKDPDDDNITYSVNNSNSDVNFSVDGTTLRASANSDFSSTYEVSIQADDASLSGYVYLTVTPEGVPQVDNPIADQTYETTGLTQTVVSDLNTVFSDVDSELDYSVITDNKYLSASITGNTVLKISADHNFEETVVVTVTASDGVNQVSDEFEVTVNTGSNVKAQEVNTPSFDGVAEENIWGDSPWTLINQTWIDYGESIDSTDYFGRYKVTWSSTDNLLYYFVEITDDAIIDGYTPLDGGYPDFDIVEVFLDPDQSGGYHTFDEDPAGGGSLWGIPKTNAENAFSYHLAPVDIPDNDNDVEHDFAAMDLAGNDATKIDFSTIDNGQHIPDFAVKKIGNQYFWEFSVKVYDDTFDPDAADNSSSRVSLSTNDQLGMSVAYCENDGGDNRDNFFGSVWVPEAAYNYHWKNSDGFGSLTLVETVGMNHQPVAINSIEDVVLEELNTFSTVIEDLNTIFEDTDSDELNFSAECSNDNVSVEVDGDLLKVKATAHFSGNAEVTVTADDSELQATIGFNVSININQQPTVENTIPAFSITRLNTFQNVVEDLNTIFDDPDGDELSFSAESDESKLEFNIDSDTLKIKATGEFSGSVSVTVTADDGELQETTSFNVDYQPTSIAGLNFDKSLICYPSPLTRDLLTIKFYNPQAADSQLKITLYNHLSKQVKFKQEIIHQGEVITKLNLEHLSPGIYLIDLRLNNSRATRKIVVQ